MVILYSGGQQPKWEIWLWIESSYGKSEHPWELINAESFFVSKTQGFLNGAKHNTKVPCQVRMAFPDNSHRKASWGRVGNHSLVSDLGWDLFFRLFQSMTFL